MTRTRKRQRTDYVVRAWSPFVDEVSTHRPSGREVVKCRTAVIVGDVMRWAPANNRFGGRMQVVEQQHVHGWWLPAQFVIDNKRARFIVDVDLVAHSNTATLEADMRRVRSARSARELARPATWTKLIIADADGSTVLLGSHQTARYAVHVTRVQVVPLPQQAGRRGQRAIVGQVPIVVNDLLEAAMAVSQVHGNLKPPPLARSRHEIGRLTATVHDAPKPTRGLRGTRTVRTHEYLAQVRAIHEAAPQGAKTQAVMQQLGLKQANAKQVIAKSQQQLKWGWAFERSKQSRKKPKKGSKT